MGTFPYKNFLYENVPNLCRAEYQRAGPGRKRQRLVYDPRRIADPQAWLVEKLGPLVHFADLHSEGEQAVVDAAVVSAAPAPAASVAGTENLPPEICEYAGGVMPLAVIAWTSERRRAAGLSQDEIARQSGLSRPQLANAEAQRFGLSQTAAARLLAVIARLRPRQFGFDLPLHANAAARS